MMGKDPFGIFRENSERELDIQPQQGTWEKIASRLDGDTGRRRRGWLMFLPWIALLGLGTLSGILLVQQSQMRSDLLDMHAQMGNNSRSEITNTDTVFIYNTITRIDTVYAVERIYIPSATTRSLEEASAQISKTLADSDLTAHPNLRNGELLPGAKSGTSEGIDHSALNSVHPFPRRDAMAHDPLGESDKEVPIMANAEAYRKKVEPITIDSVVQNSLIEEKQKSTLKTDKTRPKTLIDSMVVDAKEKQKDRISLKEKLRGLDRYWGLYGGLAVLADSKNVKNKGWTAGMAIHRQVSEHVWLGLNADFSLWRTETNQVDQVAWIPNEPSSDPALVVDLAEARMPTIGGNFAIQYRFLPERSLNPFIELGYGIRYMMWPSVRYELKSDLGNQDLIIESELRHGELIFHDLVPALGLNFWLDPTYRLAAWAGYRFNSSKADYIEPNHLKLRLGLFKRF